jgi:uncharacterized protein
MFSEFLLHLRAQGLPVGLGEWSALLRALERGIVASPQELYDVGRALLCRTEADFDRYDLAFAAAFRDAVLTPELRDQLERWLEGAIEARGERAEVAIADRDLWKTLLERLREQRERHDGGDRWVGTGGTSPFGHGGRAKTGIRVGGEGGGRSAIGLAMERSWEGYRTDRTIDVRDFEVALRSLRKLTREGDTEIDIDETVDRTARNAGDIEIVEQRARVNQVHLVLMMDAGGSMAPHHETVSRLFSAASRTRGFKSFTSYSFHNCVYGAMYRDIEQLDRLPTEKVLATFGPRHRVILVGDASMAPYELFSAFSWPGHATLAGIDWLKRLRARAPASIWLNPDPRRYWDHPTVSAIGALFPMYPLTVEGIRDAVRNLRSPA